MIFEFDIIQPLVLFLQNMGTDFIIYMCAWGLIGVVPVVVRYLFRKG